MSRFWSAFITILSIVNVLACGWLIWWTARSRPNEVDKGEVIDHVWDGDLQERNNPMPRWWLWLFYLCMIFSIVYFILYPSLGSYAGTLGWTQAGQYEAEVAAANEKYGPMYAAYAGREIPDLTQDPKALALGHSLFVHNCTTCHGSDGRGAVGFPNLTDDDWLYGGDPQTIEQTITNGRQGVMPALGSTLGEEGVEEVIAYVLSLSGRESDPGKLARGQTRFAVCAACHGADGKGTPALGAPNLTDDIWLYGGSEESIRQTIMGGRNGNMPAHAEWLGADKIRVLAAYVYSLSRGP
jgi:cytochrome c oxidase cbb3-type subunit 3